MKEENDKKSNNLLLEFISDVLSEAIGYLLFSAFGIWIIVIWGTIWLIIPVVISLVLIIRVLRKKNK